MNSNNEFSIQENALRILAEAKDKIEVRKQYPEQMRCFNFENRFIGKWCTKEEFEQCAAFLKEIGAIEFTGTPYLVHFTEKGIRMAESFIQHQ